MNKMDRPARDGHDRRSCDRPGPEDEEGRCTESGGREETPQPRVRNGSAARTVNERSIGPRGH